MFIFRLVLQSKVNPSVIRSFILHFEEFYLSDLKAKALGVPVYELFGGPLRESVSRLGRVPLRVTNGKARTGELGVEHSTDAEQGGLATHLDRARGEGL